MHIRIIERNTSTIDTMFTLEKPSHEKNQTTSIDKILQQDTMSNLVFDTSYKNIIMIYIMAFEQVRPKREIVR